MAAPVATDSDLINFDIIETHKENIQSLPGGRSVKQLASILSPLPSSSRSTGANATPTLEETKTLNDAIRQEYEIELQSIADSDDPLDIYDRYVKWTLNAYPSAQATPQSQLLPLLERATKAFLTSSHYKNDPRYLKLWLHYIRLFSDTPRETFAFLARHGIGEGLGLFYEEFAAWLEAAGRWIQADEVYKLGTEREARPTERLARKYSQFQQRFDARPQVDNEPSSPALPTVRPALAAKIDPFASAHRGDDPQARQRNGLSGSSAPTSRSGKPKMAIFSDAESVQQQPLASNNTKGWDTIGSMKERKKENTIEARPWAGEKLKAGGRVGSVPKMEVFKDPASRAQGQSKRSSSTQDSKQLDQVVNPRTGRAERVFVDLEAIYPPIGDQEFSFEELRAMSRGWAEIHWRPRKDATPLMPAAGNAAAKATSKITKSREPEDIENLTHSFANKIDLNSGVNSSLSVHDVSTQSMVGMPESDSQSSTKPPKQKEKKLKIREVKQETQTVKTRLESPTGKKLKRKNSSQEPTMTFHSKAATNEIYDMFNQPLRKPALAREETQSGDDTDFTEGEVDDGYSTAGDAESTETGRVSAPGSEYGDDTLASIRRNHSQNQSQTECVSPWSDFTTSKHVPRLDSTHFAGVKDKTTSAKNHRKVKRRDRSEDVTESIDSSSQNPTQTSGFGGFDTQAIAAIAGGNFDDLDTKAIAMMAGDIDEGATDAGDVDIDQDGTVATSENQGIPEEEDAQQQEVPGNHSVTDDDDLPTPVENEFPEHQEIPHKPRFIPIAPVDYEPTPNRPYRDPAMLAQNKMPFMTPIAERTESSFAPSTIFNAPGYFDSKTPSRSQYESPSKIGIEDLFLCSPHRQVATPTSASLAAKRKYVETGATDDEVITPSPQKKGPSKTTDLNPFPVAASNTEGDALKTSALPPKPVVRSPLTKVRKGPIIPDLQCNPCDDAVRQQILSSVFPPLSTQKGYHDHSTVTFGRYPALKSFAEKQAKTKAKSSPRKGQNDKTPSKAVPPVLKFGEATRVYAVKRELGEGAFAPVYLVDSYDPAENEGADENDKENKSPLSCHLAPARQPLEALKTESPPGTLAWEFHIVRLVRQRLGSASRSMQSIILAHECHLYHDEAYLVLSYSPQGTLLDLVNMARTENVKAGKPAEGLDEVLAMWFSVELLRTLEDLHRVGIIHSDLKGDNCLVRFDTAVDVTAPFDPEGNHGWQSRGLKLIDFGRGIDTRMFKPNAQFIADWPSCPQDCTEIRECRPWKWQIDYHGAAGVIHSLLFGKYIETVPAGGNMLAGPGQKKEWKLKENFKRYWEKDIWGDVFAALLNPGCVADGEEMPIQGNLRRVRATMEKWLGEEGERGGRDLRASVRRMERLVCAK